MFIVANSKLEPQMLDVAGVRVMRGIRFFLTFRKVRRLAHQRNFAISRLMEIIFRNMAYRSVTCELSSHREGWLRAFPMRCWGCFEPMCLFGA